ncbi:MAG TPA: LamG-like jellyroll fold domain-containing protein, partial [Candidatus Kryptonia bacterium]|nr:LamG-like jellyroll fold domain-containing protein [Candidatus Kryptonia bacterium]
MPSVTTHQGTRQDIRSRVRGQFFRMLGALVVAVVGLGGSAWGRPIDVNEGVPPSIHHWEEVTASEMQVRGAGGAAAAGEHRHAAMQMFGRTFELDLEPNPLFAPGAKNLWISDTGVREEDPAVTLYRGQVTGEPDSWVRFSLQGSAFDGMIHTPNETYFVEPRTRYFARAAANEMIAYRLSDTEPGLSGGECAALHPSGYARPDVEAIESGTFTHLMDQAATGGAAATGTYQQAQIAVVADYAYFQGHGANSASAMQSILNQIDGIYRSEVSVTFALTKTVVFTTSASDPWISSCIAGDGTTDYTCLLDSFSTYHNTSGNPVYGTNLAHLFTRRSLTGNVIGIAWIGSLCSSYYGSALSEEFTTDNKQLVLLTSHEIGHNFNAPHDNHVENPPSPCGSTPFGWIMNWYVDPSLNETFSACSKTQMSPEIASANCLTTVTDASPTPSATATPTATFTPLGPTATPSPTPSIPIGYWKFEEGAGTVVGDSSGFGNSGTAENGMLWGVGRIGGGGVFDGANDDVRVSTNSSLNLTGSGLTLEAWVKPSAVDSYHVLIHKEQQYSMAILNGQLTYADSIMWSYANMGSYGTVPAGVWSHVVVTFDGSIVRFYINGVEVGNIAHSGSLTATTNPVCLAAYNCGAFYLAGTLDEAIVYRRPLSAAEVLAHFNAAPPLATATSTVTLTSTVTQTQTLAPTRTPTLTLTGTPTPTQTQTPTLTAIPTDSPTPTLTVPGAPTVTFTIPPTATFTLPATATFTVPTPTSTVPPTVTSTVPAVPTVPVAKWSFEEGAGTVVSDSSGAGNNGTAENGMTWGVGKIGGGGVFDATNDDVRVANSTSLNITGTGLSLETWVKPTAVDSIRVLVHKELQYSLAISSGQLTFADSIMWSYANMGSYGTVPAGVWSHVVVTFDGSIVRFYVNGVEVGNKAHAGSLTATTNPVCLAAYNCSAFRFGGTLDEAMVYPRALSAAEVLAHFNSGNAPTPSRTATPTPTSTFTAAPPTATATAGPIGKWRFEEGAGTSVGDSSGSGNNGTAENGMAWGVGKVGGGGVFDGVNDDVRIANSSSLNITGAGLSIEAWVKPTAVDGIRVLVHKETQYSLAISSGQLTFADSIMWSYAGMGSYGSVPVGVWTHVAVTFDGSTLRWYVNGVEVGNKSHPGSLGATTNQVSLGSYNFAGLRFAGTLDE